MNAFCILISVPIFFYIGSVGESFFVATELKGIERKDKNLGEDLGLQRAIVIQQERKL